MTATIQLLGENFNVISSHSTGNTKYSIVKVSDRVTLSVESYYDQPTPDSVARAEVALKSLRENDNKYYTKPPLFHSHFSPDRHFPANPGYYQQVLKTLDVQKKEDLKGYEISVHGTSNKNTTITYLVLEDKETEHQHHIYDKELIKHIVNIHDEGISLPHDKLISHDEIALAIS